jgi:hypothetical protein
MSDYRIDNLRDMAANPYGKPMTARETIEARLGRNLPPTADLPPDLRTAIKMLAIANIRNRAKGPAK